MLLRMVHRRWATTDAVGERIRRSRLAMGRSRLSLGDEIGVSASMIGRMERGEGDGILVRRWVAVADALGLRLTVAAEPDPERIAALRLPPPVLTVRLIEQLAVRGGWSVTSQDDFMVVLDRPSRLERLHVYLCDRPVEILDAADARMADRAAAVAGLPRDWRVGVLIVVRAEPRDRYRPVDWLADESNEFPTSGSVSIAALRSDRVRMPTGDAIVWCDQRATRLIPFGLNLEPGYRARRIRPEIRRRACPRGA